MVDAKSFSISLNTPACDFFSTSKTKLCSFISYDCPLCCNNNVIFSCLMVRLWTYFWKMNSVINANCYEGEDVGCCLLFLQYRLTFCEFFDDKNKCCMQKVHSNSKKKISKNFLMMPWISLHYKNESTALELLGS